MSQPRKSRNVLVPLALSAAAALTGLGLYLWLGNGSSTQDSPRPARPVPLGQDHSTEVNETEFEPQQPRSRPNPTGSSKKKIAIVVREDAPGLLWNIPTPINLETTDIFILVHSPRSGGNPEKVYKLVDEVFPKEYVREYIMPYMIEAAIMPLLRHLALEAVYIDESLAGEDGATVSGLLEGNWVGAVVVATGGQGGGSSGLQQSVQKFGRRCTIISKSGIRSDWAGRVNS